MRSAPLPAEERTRRIAGLRRGLIPALTRLRDHAGAIDQYIEIINRFPDDDSVLQEAGRYARQHGRTEQLIAYYTQDRRRFAARYRWPMLLAKLETQFEHFPAAIAAYAKAIAIRPDHTDFQTARGGLEERLMRSMMPSPATQNLRAHLQDPKWMERSPSCTRVRPGDEASKALATALVDGRPERPEIFFAVGERLRQWACSRRRGRSSIAACGWEAADLLRTAAPMSASTPAFASRLRCSIDCWPRTPTR